MGKRFKFRLSRVIPESLRFSHTNTSALPRSLSSPELHLRHPSSSESNLSSPEIPWQHHHLPSCGAPAAHSSKIVSFGCGCRSRFYSELFSNSDHDSPLLHNDPRQFISGDARKIHDSSLSGEVHALPPNKSQRNRKKKAARIVDENEEKKDLLISTSTSFPDFSYGFLESSTGHDAAIRPKERSKKKKRKKRKKNVKRIKKIRRVKRCILRSWRRVKTMIARAASPAYGLLQRTAAVASASTAEGKMKESYAVVTRSVEPFEDFKRSMVEMIVENQMFERKDLEQLLHCFLSLNTRHYHGVIVEAFSEVWEALFCKSFSRKLARFS